MTVHFTELSTSLGALLLTDHGAGLSGVWFPDHAVRHAPVRDVTWRRDDARLAAAVEQFTAYLEGRRHRFELDLDVQGTPFRREVWAALHEVPPGATTTYGEVARQLGRPTSTRAVAAAVGANPLSIVVPCHRVIGADGRLTGYAGGLDRKRWLLRHEGVVLSR